MKEAIDNIGVVAFFLLIPLLISRVWITDDSVLELFTKLTITDAIILAACFIVVASYEEKEGKK